MNDIAPLANSLARAQWVMERCDELARFSEEPNRLTRPYGSPSLRAACDTVASWMIEAGMTVRRDAIGNVIGRYGGAEEQGGSFGTEADSPPLLIGGHIDTVRDAGKYDGTLGVLVGIACIEWLRAERIALPFSVEVVAFVDEDGLRFHTAYLASWAFSGMLAPDLLKRTDSDGITIREAIQAFAGDPDEVVNPARDIPPYREYVEVHIEQGPSLDAAALPVGIVSAIAGQTRLAITFVGVAGHAGTVPMALRRDPLAAAAEFVLAVEGVGRAIEGLVATVGQLTVEPGASNVVPGQVRLTLDVRHADDAVRIGAITTLLARVLEIGQSRGVEIAFSNRNDASAVACDPMIMAELAAAVTSTGQTVVNLVSGAGHDAVALSGRMPVGMLFVRCAGGISHNPAESITTEDVAVAIAVLDAFLRRHEPPHHA